MLQAQSSRLGGREHRLASLYYDVFETSFGWMGLLGSPKGLRRATLPQASPDECVDLLTTECESARESRERFEKLESKLICYFRGERVALGDEPIDVDDASPFLRAAWEACRSIPTGETRTYKWLAVQAGSPLAVRAAGQSMARNRLSIIVPCHRVIASDGGLRGFGKGASQLGLKQLLLQLEAGHSAPAPYPNP